jgi:GTP-binding protein EngB required for normal cell division
MIADTRNVLSLSPPNRRLVAAADSSGSPLHRAIECVAEIAGRYGISSLSGLLSVARASLQEDEIAVAVLGRFKAGKSSFLNDFIGRAILPVGVVPVTATVTEVRYGARERAIVRRLDGAQFEVSLGEIASYISEKENPENVKQVEVIRVELPELRLYAGLKFVDTPGLESALAHNTRTSARWLPNAGLALVAISVDPPLSQRDIELLRQLYQYTPKIAILLTKADLLAENELAEVMEFVASQLAKNLSFAPHIFPYSTRPGFEHYRQALESTLIDAMLGNLAAQRAAIRSRKIQTLIGECDEYLMLSLKSAERLQSERQQLKQQVIGEKEIVDEVKSQIHLVVQNAVAGTRPAVEKQLESHRKELESALLRDFQTEFPKWTTSLASKLSSFEGWMENRLRENLMAVSLADQTLLTSPIERVRMQAFRGLQQFRDRLSERTMQIFGVPLRTEEPEIEVTQPSAPDVRIGRVFDRNWELLSPILPVAVVKGTVHKHFEERISYLIHQNLSRLTTQWEGSIHHALLALEKEAKRRLDELIETVERMLETSGEQAPQIRTDLDRLRQAQRLVEGLNQ